MSLSPHSRSVNFGPSVARLTVIIIRKCQLTCCPRIQKTWSLQKMHHPGIQMLWRQVPWLCSTQQYHIRGNLFHWFLLMGLLESLNSWSTCRQSMQTVSYTHLRAHETKANLV